MQRAARARARGRRAAAARTPTASGSARSPRRAGFDTAFTGYETTEQPTAVGAVARQDGSVLAKLVESPFYATGGGQIADAGEVACEDGGCSARVVDVVRLGDDQALVLEPVEGELHEGERVIARVDAGTAAPPQANHTATHLLHAALRERLGEHVRQAGSYVGPDKLRFDFTHGSPLGDEDVAWVEDRVNEWVLANQPVRALTTTLDEAQEPRRDGAVRREVRRRGADGRGRRRRLVARAVRRHARALDRGDRRLQAHRGDLQRGQRPPHRGGHGPGGGRDPAPPRPRAGAGGERAAHLARPGRRGGRRARAQAPRAGEGRAARARARSTPDRGRRLDGVRRVFELAALDSEGAARLRRPDEEPARRPRRRRARRRRRGPRDLLVAATKGAVERGVKAGDIVKVAATVVGGGGGGRDTMAQAGGRHPEKLPEALDAAREEIERVLGGA